MSWLTVTMTTDMLICSVCRNQNPVWRFSYSQISLNSRTFTTIYSEFEKAEFPLLGILKDIKRKWQLNPKQQTNQDNIHHGQQDPHTAAAQRQFQTREIVIIQKYTSIYRNQFEQSWNHTKFEYWLYSPSRWNNSLKIFWKQQHYRRSTACYP
jgi:hypothetical protein